MKLIQINFRLSKHNLARALYVIRQIHPNYQITTMNNLAKTCFFKYTVQITQIKNITIPVSFLKEIEDFFIAGKEKNLDLNDIIEINTKQD